MSKTLLSSICGINDFFSHVALNIDNAVKNNLNISDLFLTHPYYDDLNKYLNFKELNYIPNVSKKDYKKYDNISIGNKGASTNLNLNTKYHLSNYISLNEKMIEKTKHIDADIGVHFRFMSHEFNRTNSISPRVAIDMNIYLKKFEEVYDKSKTYFIASSSPVLKDNFKTFNNIIFLPKDYVATKRENRKSHTEDVFFDLACLSKCSIIYKTEGSFTSAAKMLGGGVPILKNLI